MKPVLQTNTDPRYGNCFAACLASLLEVSIEEMTFDINSDTWFFNAARCVHRHGYNLLMVEQGDERFTSYLDGTYCILTGKSPRGEWNHAIVALFRTHKQDGEWVNVFETAHDPHPDGGGIESVIDYTFLVKVG